MLSDLTRRLLHGQTWREWLVEFVRFCVVGLGSYVVDVGLFNAIAYHTTFPLPGDRPMAAKVISVAVAVVFSWIVNRLWTFQAKRSTAPTREFLMFVAVNFGGMAIAVGCLWVSRSLLGCTSQVADNISANGVGLVLGTAFRYIMYRYVVFVSDAAAAIPSK